MKHLCMLFILFSFYNLIVGQVTSTTSDGRTNTKPLQAEARILQVTSDAGSYFKQGLLNLQDNRRRQAREDFDHSVEVFLTSGINLTSNDNAKARDCYNQLIETVYRMEFPNEKQTPQIRSLSATCSWNIDNKLADDIAKLVLTSPGINAVYTPSTALSLNASVIADNSAPLIGLANQKFEPSPLDDLAKLELDVAPPLKRTESPNKDKTRPGSRVPSEFQTVRVLAGDTVLKIALRYNVSSVDVANLNGFSSVLSSLKEGSSIKIPQRKLSEKNLPNSLTVKSKNLSKNLCNLDVSASPALRGVKLGMPPSVVSKTLGVPLERGLTELLVFVSEMKKADGRPWDPTDQVFMRLLNEKGTESSVTKKKEYIKLNLPGYISYVLRGDDNKALKGVTLASLKFYESRLYEMNYSYATDAFDGMTDKEFILALNSVLGLPEKYWDQSGHFSCQSFSVWTFRGKSTVNIQIKSVKIQELIERKKQELVQKMYEGLKKKIAEERKKSLEEKGFKP